MHAAQLPPERPLRVGIVCTGNICRSPSADVVLAELVRTSGAPDLAIVDSSGLGGWHVGDGMDRRSARHLSRAGYDPSTHRAQQFTRHWWSTHDLILAMDAGHLIHLQELAPSGWGPDRLRLFSDFDPLAPGVDVPDPYYGGDAGFADVLATIERTCRELVRQLLDP